MTFLLLLVLVALQLAAPTSAQAPEVDPALRSVVERFFATQESEDAAAYMALWSAKGNRPRPEQLKYVFESGDDRFSMIDIVSARVMGDTARVRVRVLRERTAAGPDGKPRTFKSSLVLALTLAREGSDWKILREGSLGDELAETLLETDSPDARAALLQAERDLVNARLVEAMWRRADPLAQQGQYRAAQAIYERSLEVARAAGDRKSEGQAIQNIANSLYFQREYDRATRLYEQRLSLEREIANEEGISNALLGLATVRYSVHEYGAALDLYREALAIQERLDDQVLVSTTLISTGNVLFLQGDYEGAIRDYRRAQEIKLKYFDLVGATAALEGLGRVYTAQGDYASALAAYDGVLDERRKRNDEPRQALALQSIGEIHIRLGNLDQARSSFNGARVLFEKAGDAGATGRVLQGTALTELVAGRFPLGEKAYRESVASCAKASDHECVARAQVGLAFALSAQQKFVEAIESYRKAIAGFTALAQKEAVARAQVGLAEALGGKGDYEAALEQAAHARQAAVVMNSDDVLWRALVAQARAERKLGRSTDALGAARAGVAAVRRMAAASLERPLQAVPRDTTAAYAMLAVLQADAGDAAGAFDTAEELRAHALRLWLAPHEREIARGMTADERAEERTLATGLTTLLVGREREAALPKPDAARLAKLDTAIVAAVRARNAARAGVFARLPELASWRGLTPAPTTRDLDALLDVPSKLLVDLVVDDKAIVVLTARRPEAESAVLLTAHTVAIERSLLGERIARALDGTSLTDVAAWRSNAGQVFNLLPVDVLSLIRAASTVIVMPDDLLWRMPFEAMPVDGGYLADRAVVTYLPSLRAVSVPAASPPPDGVATIVTGPQLAATVVDELKVTAPSWTLRPADVASAEATAVSAVMTDPAPRLLAGMDATAASAKSAAASAPIVHIGAPFRINAASPLFSAVLLTDSRLDARDVFEWQTSATVVTLADPAALSMRDGASAIVPIHWAWKAAGSEGMIVRRWGGSEEQGASLLARTYEKIREGKGAAEALHAARAAARQAAATRAPVAPASWAGWLVLSGR